MSSGYTDCKCRDCFDTTVSNTSDPDFCSECENAGCEEGDQQCSRDDAYGVSDCKSYSWTCNIIG